MTVDMQSVTLNIDRYLKSVTLNMDRYLKSVTLTVDGYWKERYAVLNTKYEQLYDKG